MEPLDLDKNLARKALCIYSVWEHNDALTVINHVREPADNELDAVRSAVLDEITELPKSEAADGSD